jgi:3-oxoacyl-[acyl-carrier protein] reductase
MSGPGEGKTLVLTGGSYGIGLGIARRFLSDGYRVVIIGRDEAKLARAQGELGGAVRGERGDVGLRSDVARIAASVKAKEGSVDVLINNAGLLATVTVEDGLEKAEAVFDSMVGASLKGTFLMVHAFAPMLASPGGRIINLGSIVAHSGGSIPGFSAYAGSKAGVHGLTLGFARELGPKGITVNTVAPGFIADTGQTEEWTGQRIGPILAQVPLGRAGAPADIAGACAFLASADGGYVTGMTLAVTGGWRFYQ